MGKNDIDTELTTDNETAERGVVCMFCGEGFGYAGETPDEETLKAAVEHEAKCPRNPYKQEIAELQNRVAELEALRSSRADICSVCKKDNGYDLSYCESCNEPVCDNCSVSKYDHVFCSDGCADSYYHIFMHHGSN